MSNEILLDCTGAALLDCTGAILIGCDAAPATYTTRAVAHIRAGNGGASGDWELGLGTSTNNITHNGQYPWPNNEWVQWSLDYSGPGGTLTLTVGTGYAIWTPGSAIPNDNTSWKLLLELYAAAGYTSQIGTQNVKLTIGGHDYPLDDMLVQSGSNTSSFILPHQLGNQSWSITGEVGLGWSGTFPNASRLQAILRLQQEDTP